MYFSVPDEAGKGGDGMCSESDWKLQHSYQKFHYVIHNQEPMNALKTTETFYVLAGIFHSFQLIGICT